MCTSFSASAHVPTLGVDEVEVLVVMVVVVVEGVEADDLKQVWQDSRQFNRIICTSLSVSENRDPSGTEQFEVSPPPIRLEISVQRRLFRLPVSPNQSESSEQGSIHRSSSFLLVLPPSSHIPLLLFQPQRGIPSEFKLERAQSRPHGYSWQGASGPCVVGVVVEVSEVVIVVVVVCDVDRDVVKVVVVVIEVVSEVVVLAEVV